MGWQAQANTFVPLPVRSGVGPSYLWLPETCADGMLAFLVRQYPNVTEDEWRDRMRRGEVVDGQGVTLGPASPALRGTRIWYYRELEGETPVPFEEQVLFRDQHLLVVDKPHFLPTMPAGRFLHETLLVRLKDKLALPDLVPIHRLDRETAGVVIFSHCAASRGAYQSLFQKRSVEKVYEALAGPIEGHTLPLTWRSRMVEGTPFFRMREEEGEPNSETAIELLARQGDICHYRLRPHTGRKHQLRLHMASLGAPILNDPFYPVALPCKGDDYSRPLQLLARGISFTDPLTGEPRAFESQRELRVSDWGA